MSPIRTRSVSIAVTIAAVAITCGGVASVAHAQKRVQIKFNNEAPTDLKSPDGRYLAHFVEDSANFILEIDRIRRFSKANGQGRHARHARTKPVKIATVCKDVAGMVLLVLRTTPRPLGPLGHLIPLPY